jgi:hypothetical protein
MGGINWRIEVKDCLDKKVTPYLKIMKAEKSGGMHMPK